MTTQAVGVIDSKPTDLERLATLVRERREGAGFTQAQMASAAGVSDTTWNQVERGKPISGRMMARIAQGLGWTPDSCKRVLAGEDPVEVNAPAPAPVDYGSRMDAIERRQDRMEALLRELLDEVRRG